MDALTAAVVIPCYNAAETVGSAVGSALAQTRPPAAVICVDDGSTDDTLAVIAQLERDAGGRLQVITQARAGACAARNAGLARVTAPWVQFLDADDQMHPGKLDHQLGLIESRASSAGTAGPDIVAGSFLRLRADGRSVRRIAQAEDWWAALAWVRLGITSSNLFRREAVERAGGWNTAWASSQEYELMFRMLQQGATVAFDPEIFTILRQRPDSITLSTPEANVERRIALGAAIRDHVRQRGSAEAVEAAQEALFFVVQMQCAYSLARGTESYRTHFSRRYVPPAGRAYRALHRTLGFERAQRVRLAARRVARPPARPTPLSLSHPATP